MKEDIAQVEAVRAAVGDRMEIMVDANQAQEPGTPGSETDLVWGYDRALATCRELAHLGVVWMEEPLGRFEFDNLRRLAAASDVPIAGGENNIGLHEFRCLIDQDCYDVIQPDAAVFGGLSGLRKIAAYAELRHKPVAPHHGGSGLGVAAHLHLSASLPNSPYVELLQEPPALPVETFQGMHHRTPDPRRRRQCPPPGQTRSRRRTKHLLGARGLTATAPSVPTPKGFRPLSPGFQPWVTSGKDDRS